MDCQQSYDDDSRFNSILEYSLDFVDRTGLTNTRNQNLKIKTSGIISFTKSNKKALKLTSQAHLFYHRNLQYEKKNTLHSNSKCLHKFQHQLVFGCS